MDIQCTPPEVVEAANDAVLNLLPEKSKQKYEFAYDRFTKWCASKKVTSCSENTMLAYFADYVSL